VVGVAEQLFGRLFEEYGLECLILNEISQDEMGMYVEAVDEVDVHELVMKHPMVSTSQASSHHQK
jgi:hypothetical protein